MAKAIKVKQKPLDIFIVSITVLLLFTIAILTVSNLVRLNVDCQDITDKTTKLIDKKQYRQTYDLLNPNIKTCGDIDISKMSSKEKLLQIQFHRNLAVSAYALNKKTQATTEANRGLALNTKLTATEKTKVDKLVFDMLFIKDGLY